MRLGKRERLALGELKRLRRKQVRKHRAEVKGMSSVVHNSFVARNGQEAKPVSSSSPGANLLRYERNKDKPTYSVERQPKLSSRPKNNGQVKRFATI